MQAFGAFELMDEGDLPDSLWVRGRLPGLFKYQPLEIADGRPYLLNAGFVAFRPESGRNVVRPFAVTDECCGYSRLVLSGREAPSITSTVARQFWDLIAGRGIDQDFRVTGLEWAVALDENGEWTEEAFWEVGRWGGVYYAECVAHDNQYDPDAGRPDASWHRYRSSAPERRRRVRRCL